jgi:hypothetical protein
MDASVTRRRQQRVRTRRYRRRQRKGVRIVSVEVSERVLAFLIESGRLGATEALSADRSVLARRIAELAEDACSAWECREGRISTEP